MYAAQSISIETGVKFIFTFMTDETSMCLGIRPLRDDCDVKYVNNLMQNKLLKYRQNIQYPSY